MSTLILLRHGQSQWNLENRFTGWTDIPLTELGRQEATRSAHMISDSVSQIDRVHTSVLERAVNTLDILQSCLKNHPFEVFQNWRLNERHYGSLQGLNKADTAQRFGTGLVMGWRRGYSEKPPALELDDHRHPRFDPIYSDIPSDYLPRTESLADTEARLLPYWKDKIQPELQSGKTVLIVSHGNTLRALVRWIEAIAPSQVPELNIPTGIPLFYHLEFLDGSLAKHLPGTRLTNETHSPA